jgi:vesicle-associated membrane protein 7
VAHGSTILAEHQAGKRDFSQGMLTFFFWLYWKRSITDKLCAATQTILSKIPPNDRCGIRICNVYFKMLINRHSKMTYVWEQYLFHYISDGGFTYLVMADDSAERFVTYYISLTFGLIVSGQEDAICIFS